MCFPDYQLAADEYTHFDCIIRGGESTRCPQSIGQACAEEDAQTNWHPKSELLTSLCGAQAKRDNAFNLLDREIPLPIHYREVGFTRRFFGFFASPDGSPRLVRGLASRGSPLADSADPACPKETDGS